MKTILRYICMTSLLVFPVVLNSCRRELLPRASDALFQGDGTVTDIRLPYNARSSVQVTKALSDESERQVNDLYVIMMPVKSMSGQGQFVFDSAKPLYKRYFPSSTLYPAVAEDHHYNAGYVTLDGVPTGSYILVAVANVRSSEYANSELYEALQTCSSWDEYNGIRASLQTQGSVNRVAPALLMSGIFLQDGSDDRRTVPDLVTVRNNVAINGWIHLRRVDSHVRFVVSNNIPHCTAFNVYEWQVYNVPGDVIVSNMSSSTPSTKANSSARTDFSISGNEFSFDFYIPEYTYTSSDSGLDMIRKRAKRTDDDSQWLYAPEDAPYIVFKANMEMLVDNPETGEYDVRRHADARYIVHLGACEGNTEAEKAKDFNTNRNYRFTYNVRINGVDDIVVEARREGDVEYNHNVEGVVMDNTGGYTYNFDSHYSVANVVLSVNDLKKMSVRLNSVWGEQYYDRDFNGQVTSTLVTDSEDFQAFRFAFERESSVQAYQHYPAQPFVARYVSYSKTYDAGKYIMPQHNETSVSKDSEHTYPLYDLRSMLEGLPFSGDAADPAIASHLAEADAYRIAHSDVIRYETVDDIPLIFTMFVNENVYYRDVDNWYEHTNSVDRVLRMFTTSDVSEDGRSEYIRGRYNFVQKPCQTYYSDVNNEALCVEYVNEHHHKDLKNTMGVDAGAGGSVKTGWPTTNSVLSTHLWNDYSDQTMPLCEHYNAFRTYSVTNARYAKGIPGNNDANDYEAVCAVLSRNRDLNRDGIIDSNELKWFLPSMEQYIQIVIGGGALASKLFVPDDYWNWDESLDGSKGNIFGNVRFHFIGVETRSKFWAEEGYTVGNQSVHNPAESSDGWSSNPWELRCVRMLVSHDRIQNEESHWADFEDLYYFANRDKNVISMERYNSNLFRPMVTSWIDLHHNSDDFSNSTFTHFQFARNDASLVDRNPGEVNLVDRMHTNGYCSSYYEADDASDLGTWRTPNQRETAVMRYLAGININTAPNSGAYYLSCSIWPFPSSGGRTYQGKPETIDFCTIGSNPTKSSPSGQLSQLNLRVRCVRDTDRDGNFVGTPEYGNPVGFVANPDMISFRYNEDGSAVAEFGASMTSGVVTGVRASVGDADATTVTGGVDTDEARAEVTFTPTSSQVTVIWSIDLVNGTTLSYRQPYTLPARYWMISRYGVDGRYATINMETERTTVSPTYQGDINDAPALYKWIVTRSLDKPVNETVLTPGVTYYFLNAGSETYINGPTGGAQAYMTTGANPVSIQLLERAGYSGYHVIRLNDSTNANSNGGVGNFGTWTNVDDGSTYKLTPVVMRGEMPLPMDFDEDIIINPDGYSVHITTLDDAVPSSVTIDGKIATVTGNDGSYTATIVTSSVSGAVISTSWTMSYRGETIVRNMSYSLPAKYWVIESGKDDSHRVASSSNGVTALTTEGGGNIELLPANYKWVVSRSVDAIENVSKPIAGEYYYLFNIGEDAFLNVPSAWATDLTSLTVGGQSPMRVQFLDSGYDGCFSMKAFDGDTFRGWINRVSNGFGYWNTTLDKRTEDGNRWRLRATVRETPMLGFRFVGELREDAGYYVSEAEFNSEAALSVMIGNVPAEISRSGNIVTAKVPISSVASATFSAVWSLTLSDRNYVKEQHSSGSYWAFRDCDFRERAVTAGGELTVYKRVTTDDRQIPSDCRWLLLLPGDDSKTNQTPSLPTNGTYLPQNYILYNVGTGLFLGPPSNGTVNSANFRMVSDINQAQLLEIGGNRVGMLCRVSIGGQAGYFERTSDMSLGVNGGLHHAWYFRCVIP